MPTETHLAAAIATLTRSPRGTRAAADLLDMIEHGSLVLDSECTGAITCLFLAALHSHPATVRTLLLPYFPR